MPHPFMTHPGIDLVDRLRANNRMDEDQIRGYLVEQKSGVNMRLANKEAAMGLDGRDKEQIELLRTLEVALAFQGVFDPYHSVGKKRMEDAMNGVNSTGGFLDSTKYTMAVDEAEKAKGRDIDGTDFVIGRR